MRLFRGGTEIFFRFLRIAVSLAFCSALISTAGQAADGEPPPLVLGQSCALSGPSKNLGQEMRAGLLAAFAWINDQGGVHGRRIRLISLDDSYEPDRAIQNTLRLLSEDKVFLVIGEVGTPTSQAVLPIIEEQGVPFFAPLTGAELLRTPDRYWVINVRASYFQEMEGLTGYLVDHLGLTRIACFYQNDGYGFAGLEGIERALARRGMDLVARGSYERNTVAVMGALREIDKAGPQAIVMAGAYGACAEFIKLHKAKGRNRPLYCNISFVGTESLHRALGGHGEDVIVSQVVPFPGNGEPPLLREYAAAMEKYQRDAPLSFITLEGYIAGRLFAAVASQVRGELTRDKFISAMEETGRFDLGGLILTFGPGDRQGLDTVYLTGIHPSIHLLDAN